MSPAVAQRRPLWEGPLWSRLPGEGELGRPTARGAAPPTLGPCEVFREHLSLEREHSWEARTITLILQMRKLIPPEVRGSPECPKLQQHSTEIHIRPV